MRLIILTLAAVLWGCSPDAPPPAASAPGPAAAPATTPAAAPVTTPATAGLVASDAWVRQVPPAARMTAGYLRVHNPGAAPVEIVGVESPQFGSVEMHDTIMADGVARMRHQDTVGVPPGETVNFEPGGLHLMLMQPVNGVPSSGTVDLTLLLADGGRIEVVAPVGQPGN